MPALRPRNNDEFTFNGEIATRPGPEATPTEWRGYLYQKNNVSGWQAEQWFHVSGCRRFLRVERHTATNEIRSVTDVSEAGQ